MLVFPNIKLNLGLYVVSKRNDGYHDIETLFYPIKGLSDMLEILPSDLFIFKQSGIAVGCSSDDNLCVKAYKLLANEFELPPVQIYLHKIIPAGGGLGGGSSDASHTLLCLNEIFHLKLSVEVLKSYAAKLGSDCAFFIDNRPSLASGRGEIMSEGSINLQDFSILLVKPDVHVSTADAYAGIVPQQPKENLVDIISSPVNTWKGRLSNDFESSIFKRFPEIETIKSQLYDAGAIYASMSGSGATVFGLFDRSIDMENVRNHFKSYWTYCEN